MEGMYKRREKGGVTFLKKGYHVCKPCAWGSVFQGYAMYKRAKAVPAEAEWKMCNVPNSLSL